jgi:hypothetical protein
VRALLLIMLAVAMTGAVAGCAGSAEDYSPAYELATLDSNTLPTGEDDPALVPYRTALQRLHNLCRDHLRTEGIASQAVKAQELMSKEHGVDESLLQILDDAVSLHEAAQGNLGTCA